MSKKRRLLEHLKTLIIAALFISALFLTYKTWVYSDKFLEDPSLIWLKNIAVPLGLYDEPVPILPSIIDVELSEASRPIMAAVSNPKGRYGAMYDFAATDAVYDRVKDALGEALASSAEPEYAGDDEWQAALLKEGVYLEFPDAIPLFALCEWLGNNPPSYLDTYSKRLLLTGGTDGLTELYYTDESSLAYYKCTTGAGFKSIENAINDFSPNGAVFLFETDADYWPVNKFTLLNDMQKTAFLLSAGIPERTEDHKYAILKSMAFNPNINNKYPAPDGTEVFVDNARTLRISANGEVLYHSVAADAERDLKLVIKKRGDTPSLPEIIEAARALSYDALLPGDARLCLSSVTQNGQRTTVSFDYVFDGMRVFLNGGRHAAQITAEGGVITEARLYMRTYTKTEKRGALESMDMLGLIFPERSDFYLMLGYFDEGAGEVKAGWYAD